MNAKNKYAVALGRRGGRVGGKSRSAAKTKAARANGRKGGRPKILKTPRIKSFAKGSV